MRERSFKGLGPHGFHRVAYTEWGDPQNPRVVVCVHGLTRTARDFDFLARALEDECRVVCPDVPGRGASEWLAVKEDYGYPLYCADTAALLARLDVEEVDWVGTSMGGLVGMMIAAMPGAPLRRMVLNDIGPLIPKAALERIVSYVGTAPTFESRDALEAYLREVHAPFGALPEAQWRHIAEHSARRLADGGWALHYDPGIGEPLRAAALEEVDLWQTWEAIRCPVLVLRGADSDVLPASVAREMTRRGPRADLEEIEGVGHAPMLMSGEQIGLVRGWLLGGDGT